MAYSIVRRVIKIIQSRQLQIFLPLFFFPSLSEIEEGAISLQRKRDLEFTKEKNILFLMNNSSACALLAVVCLQATHNTYVRTYVRTSYVYYKTEQNIHRCIFARVEEEEDPRKVHCYCCSLQKVDFFFRKTPFV